jgi:hypothetical protein
VLVPATLVAVWSTRSAFVRSSAVTTYEPPVAPLISTQPLPQSSTQRCHWYA